MKDMDSWQGAFISSTSRLLLPVCEVAYQEGQGLLQHKVSAAAAVAAIGLVMLLCQCCWLQACTISIWLELAFDSCVSHCDSSVICLHIPPP